jgi:hypothetical protein
MKLKLFFDGESVTVTSERAAKTWAKKMLGVKQVYETPTENGWQYWGDSNEESEDEVVTVLVL